MFVDISELTLMKPYHAQEKHHAAEGESAGVAQIAWKLSVTMTFSTFPLTFAVLQLHVASSRIQTDSQAQGPGLHTER